MRLVFEPGRFIVANAGVLLTQVIRVKPGVEHPFVIVDAAMNDLMRPTLYDAWHAIEAVRPSGRRMTANVVGPVCETGDTFAIGREMDAVRSRRLVRVPHAPAPTPRPWPAPTTAARSRRRCWSMADRWAVVRPRIDVQRLIDADAIPEWVRPA